VKPDRLRIYEAHLGKFSESSDMSSYRYFTKKVLPRVRDIGYNCVLLMAVTDHPYCYSCDSQAANFFATPSYEQKYTQVNLRLFHFSVSIIGPQGLKQFCRNIR